MRDQELDEIDCLGDEFFDPDEEALQIMETDDLGDEVIRTKPLLLTPLSG